MVRFLLTSRLMPIAVLGLFLNAMSGLVSLAVPFSVPEALAQDKVLPVAFNSRIVGDDATTRFFIDFDKNLRIRTFYMDEPYRIIIDLEEVTFNFGEEGEPKARGQVEAIQIGRISEGRSRIVLQLDQPAEIISASMQQRLDEDHFRFLMDFDSTDEQTFARLLDTQGEQLGESGGIARKGNRPGSAKPDTVSDGRFTIVLDPGHGGIDGGANGRSGVREKDIVLAAALIVEQKLLETGQYNVLMTRRDDTFVSLRERLDFNRRAKADLFISFHADSLRQRYVRGATVYTLSKKASDRLSERLAESENSADLVAGLAVESDLEAVTDILFDLTARETKKFSREFSRIVVTEFEGNIKLIKNPLRSAAFGVLKAPDVPGILLELGYLSNSEDEALLQQRDWQQRLATHLTQSINRFFDVRQPD